MSGNLGEAKGIMRRLSLPHGVGGTVTKNQNFGKIESYRKLEKLGEGTYATVYKGISL